MDENKLPAERSVLSEDKSASTARGTLCAGSRVLAPKRQRLGRSRRNDLVTVRRIIDGTVAAAKEDDGIMQIGTHTPIDTVRIRSPTTHIQRKEIMGTDR